MIFKMVGTAVAILSCVVSASASAGTQTGTVTNVSVDNNGSPYVFLMSGQRVDPPACAQDGYWAISNISTDSAKAMLSIVLTAYSLGRAVYVYGTGTCPSGYAREAVGYVIAQ